MLFHVQAGPLPRSHAVLRQTLVLSRERRHGSLFWSVSIFVVMIIIVIIIVLIALLPIVAVIALSFTITCYSFLHLLLLSIGKPPKFWVAV